MTLISHTYKTCHSEKLNKLHTYERVISNEVVKCYKFYYFTFVLQDAHLQKFFAVQNFARKQI